MAAVVYAVILLLLAGPISRLWVWIPVCPQNEHGEKRLDLASASRLPSAIAATASQDDFSQI